MGGLPNARNIPPEVLPTKHVPLSPAAPFVGQLTARRPCTLGRLRVTRVHLDFRPLAVGHKQTVPRRAIYVHSAHARTPQDACVGLKAAVQKTS